MKRHYLIVIKTFADKRTAAIFEGLKVRRLDANIQRRTAMKLQQLDAAVTLEDMMIPPGNRLEVLAGDRKGQSSIRVNQQYRVCFKWEEGNSYDVEFCDYH